MRFLGVLRHRVVLLRRHEPDEVVARPCALGLVGLIRDDGQSCVHLHRVGDDDLGAESLGQ